MPRSRQVGAHAGGKGGDLWEAKGMNNTNQKMTTRWLGVWGFWFSSVSLEVH